MNGFNYPMHHEKKAPEMRIHKYFINSRTVKFSKVPWYRKLLFGEKPELLGWVYTAEVQIADESFLLPGDIICIDGPNWLVEYCSRGRIDEFTVWHICSAGPINHSIPIYTNSLVLKLHSTTYEDRTTQTEGS